MHRAAMALSLIVLLSICPLMAGDAPAAGKSPASAPATASKPATTSTPAAGATSKLPAGADNPLWFTSDDPTYVEWRKAWLESRKYDVLVARGRHAVATAAVLNALKLTDDQAKALLPLALEARQLSRQYQANCRDWAAEIATWKIRFAVDCLTEDLVPFRGAGKVTHGNYDAYLWNAVEKYRHPGGTRSEKDSIPLKELRAKAKEFRELLTAEQVAVLDVSQASKSPLAPQVRSLRGNDYPGAYNFVPVCYLGTLNTGNSFNVTANSPELGMLVSPNLAALLERRLGLKLSEESEPQAVLVDLTEGLVGAKFDRIAHHRMTVATNWTKGMQITPAQTEKLAGICRELAKLYTLEERDYAQKAQELAAVQEKMLAAVVAGQETPPDVAERNKAMSAAVCGSWWAGGALGQASAEDNSFHPRTTGIWKMFPQETDALLKQVEDLLLDSQKIVLWDVHGDCYKPWFTFTDPVLVGGAPMYGEQESPRLAQARTLDDAKYAALRDKMADEWAAAQQKSAADAKRPGFDWDWGGADFVSMAVPTTMVAGKAAKVTVTMKNTWKDRTWKADAMQLQLSRGAGAWGVKAAPLPAGTSVAPGAEYTFEFEVKPTAAGYYPLQWRMAVVKEKSFGLATPPAMIEVLDEKSPAAAAQPSKVTADTIPQFHKDNIAALVDAARKMTDTQYQLYKYTVGEWVDGKTYQFTSDPNGYRTREQNGLWPQPDFSGPCGNNDTPRGRLVARMEFICLPDMYAFYLKRLELAGKMAPIPPANLEALPPAAQASVMKAP